MSVKTGPRGDRAVTTSAEMSQMSQIHSYRERGWQVRGFAVRLCRAGSGDKEIHVLLCFRPLSVGG